MRETLKKNFKKIPFAAPFPVQSFAFLHLEAEKKKNSKEICISFERGGKTENSRKIKQYHTSATAMPFAAPFTSLAVSSQPTPQWKSEKVQRETLSKIL